MPEKRSYKTPGVYIKRISSRPTTIAGVSTSVAGFVGPSPQGPVGESTLVTDVASFERIFGKPRPEAPAENDLGHAVRAFFAEGGKKVYVVRIGSSTEAAEPEAWLGASGLEALEPARKDTISVVACPGASRRLDAARPVADRERTLAIQRGLVRHAENDPYRFCVLDSIEGDDLGAVRVHRDAVESKSAALYYPWVRTVDGGTPLLLPPSGFLAGIYARVDSARGVHKAPANEKLRLATGFEVNINKNEQEVLNPEGVCALRTFAGRGHLVWGARTTTSDPEWKYINVRRLFLYLEHSIEIGTQWAVFEPNGEPLWAQIRSSIESFFYKEWKRGAFQGEKPEDAFFVRCDRSTMTQDDIDNGRLICEMGVSVIRPAEFVIFRLSRRTADAS